METPPNVDCFLRISLSVISRPPFIRVPIPLSPKSDQHEISPYNINALENIVVMRNEYTISEDKSISLIDNSINSPHYFY